MTWSSVSYLIDSFANSVDEYTLQPNQIWRLWEWNSNIDECAQHMMFRVDVDPGEIVTIRSTYNVFGYPFELMQPTPIHFELEAPNVPSFESYAMCSDLNQGDVDTISRSQLKEAASNGLISEATAEQLLSSNEEFYYITTNSKMVVGDNIDESNSSTDCMDQEINNSEIISSVFSRHIKIETLKS